MKQNPPSRLDNLLRPDVLAAFDRAFFEREGYWVWKGVLTDEGRAQWSASLQKLQALNDTVVRHSDWCAVDYQSRDIFDPDPEKITNEFLAACTGGSEQMKFMPPELREYMYQQGIFDPALATDGFDWQGIFPEYFPLAYDDFILDIATTLHNPGNDLQDLGRFPIGDGLAELEKRATINETKDLPYSGL